VYLVFDSKCALKIVPEGCGAVTVCCSAGGTFWLSCCAVWGVSPFTVGRSPSGRGKTAGVPAPSGARGALRRLLPSRDGERREPVRHEADRPERDFKRAEAEPRATVSLPFARACATWIEY